MAPVAGLTSAEAAQRLERYGYNELSTASRRSWLAILWDEAREPMVVMLLACGAVYLSFGDLKEALILLASVFLVIGITLFQERKTERALEALRNLSSPRASVIRDGKAVRIPGREVVPGDLLLLEEGDRVPADARLLSASELRVDESLLTGESVAVAKEPSSLVHASTLVVRGRGHAQVEATGLKTEVGKIGHALGTVTAGDSPLRREIRELVRVLAVIAVAFCLLIVLGWGWVSGSWREGLLAGLTLAMSLLPEEFPVVLTIFFALGAYRIARQRVLTRRLPAIETLGAATVLCADKTGTMTENRMRVTHYTVGLDSAVRKADDPLDTPSQELAALAALACPPDSFDPVDQAAATFGVKAVDVLSDLREESPVQEYPLSADRPLIAEVRAWKKGFFYAVKGAPEAVAKLCRWDASDLSRLPQRMQSLTTEGLRVIAVAKAVLQEGPLPSQLADVPFEFAGLLGMTDPLRPGVREAVQECRSAGVQVMMITGDYPQTAAVIARQAGLKETDVFARATPADKLRLVQALKNRGEVVAMTGDGVNDAPALKAAHIGIAMGGRGTDVAREAADLVVLDDNFVSIVGAIRLGRRIYANLQKSLCYLLSVHVPIAGMALLPLVMGWPLFFTPIHIVFLELVIDPACSLVFEGEAEEADLMKQPPRPRNSRLLDRRRVLKSLLDGLMVWGVTAAVFGLGLRREAGELDARALGFATLVLGNLVLILVNRTGSQDFWKVILTPNRAWAVVTAGALAALATALYVPPIRTLFQFSFLHLHDIVLCAAALIALLGLFYLARTLSKPILLSLCLLSAAPAWSLFIGNDQFNREQLNNEALLDREYFTNLLGYAPFWEPLPAALEPRAFIRNTEGSLTGERFFVRREARIRGAIGERSFWGYQLQQKEDLEEDYFYQFFEAQAALAGPLSFRFFGQPTAKKQDSDLGAGIVLDTQAGLWTLEGTWVDFNFNSRNLSDERDRNDLYNARVRVQTPPGSRWQGEASWEWDSPVEREFPDDDQIFGHGKTAAHASVIAGPWFLQMAWKREHRNLVSLSSGTLVQDFRRQAWRGDLGWLLKEGDLPVRFGTQVHRRTADFIDRSASSLSDVRSRWEINPYVMADWRPGKKCVLETGLYAALGRENFHDYGEAKLKTGLRVDFNPDVSLLLNPTWDADRLFTHRTFDGGNIQFQARIP